MENRTELTLKIAHLNVSIKTENGLIKPVNDISLEIPRGKVVGIVGESGCGKSMTARAVMGLLPPATKIEGGSILLDGNELTGYSEEQLCGVRGSEVSMIFQEPMTSLNPVIKVGRQVDEMIRVHMKLPAGEARNRTIEIFRAVGISEPEERYNCYPHQLSGGLRQRVMIAMAMIMKPSLLIADEPTTALDVTVEAQILDLMKKLCEGGTSVLLISHNLGAVAQVCDFVYVMYAGRIVEEADICTLFDHPAHPYTRGLLRAVSSLRSGGSVLDTIPGNVPNLLHLPDGCSFSPRCGCCTEECGTMPELREISPGHRIRCCRGGEEAAV